MQSCNYLENGVDRRHVLKDRETLIGMFRRARERTPEVARMLEKDGFVIQTAAFMSLCLGRTSAITYNLKMPNRLRCVRMQGIAISSYSGVACT